MKITPLIMGCTAAMLAVLAQAFLYLQPPPAYGLCLVCHGRDLVIWLFSALTTAKRDVAAASAYWPLLTVVGIFLGSRYAAVTHGEHQEQQGERPWIAFLCGMGVMVLGLVIMGCPTRLLLRAAYGDVSGTIGIAAVLLGVAAATFIIRWRVRKC